MTDCMLGWVAGVIGMALVLGAVVAGLVWRAARHWKRVPARVKLASIHKRIQVKGPTLVVDQFRPCVVYEYEVFGKIYEGQRMSLYERGLWIDDKVEVENKISEMKGGLMVWVSPRQPGKSMVDNKMGFREWRLLGVLGLIGICFAGVGFWVVWVVCPLML